MDGRLCAGLESVQVSGNDFGRSQAVLLRALLDSASPSLACSCSAWSRVPLVDVQFATRPSQQIQNTRLKRHEAGVGSQT
jgi:hypothetical protein